MKRADRMRTRGQASAKPEEIAVVREAAPVIEEVKPVAEKSPDVRDPLGQISKYIQSMDWGRVRASAKKAIESGIAEDHVSRAIDESLPNGDSASRLPLHHLFAVAAAASPEKRQEYMQAIRNYPGLETLPPESRGHIMEHMKLIGMEA